MPDVSATSSRTLAKVEGANMRRQGSSLFNQRVDPPLHGYGASRDSAFHLMLSPVALTGEAVEWAETATAEWTLVWG